MRTLVASLLALLAGSLVVHTVTDGLRAFTAEGVRRLRVQERPMAVPDALLIDADASRWDFAEWRGKVLLAEFIYTSCPTICQEMGSAFSQVQAEIKKRKFNDDVRLLSLSFDIHDDRPADLKAYGERYNADSRIWQIVKPATQNELSSLLDVFGVKVIPDPIFKFQHNAAVHVVDRHGRLVRIVDIAAREAIEAMLTEVARR